MSSAFSPASPLPLASLRVFARRRRSRITNYNPSLNQLGREPRSPFIFKRVYYIALDKNILKIESYFLLTFYLLIFQV